MSASEEILRVAAKGDGVTASGRHVAYAAPGDKVTEDGTVIPGPHHAEPACPHFGTCGGCELQHLDDAALADFVTDRVIRAANGQGLEPEELLPVHLSPWQSRRRATLHAQLGGGRPQIGFRQAKSHRLVDLTACPVLRPELFDLVPSLRTLLARRKGRHALDIEIALTEQGVDVGIAGLPVEGLAETEAMLDFAREARLARLTLDQGFGPEPVWEPDPVTVELAGVSVSFPPGAFMQATADGEAVLIEAAREWLQGAANIADLFAGLGTFAFALAGPAKVLAAEAAQVMHFACSAAARSAGRPVFALHRDLFRNPLRPEELARFDAVLLDPPRAGAREQVKLLSESSVERIVYVSCNPASWSRDAKVLAEGGYRLTKLRPVGQFRWSTHVELVSLFARS